MEKNKKAEYALPRLHDALQRFAITFYSLRKFKFKIGIEDNWAISKRNEIISAMETEVLSVSILSIFSLGVFGTIKTIKCNYFSLYFIDIM